MRILRLILAALLLVSGAGAASVTVTVLVTTDLHGNLFPVDYFTGAPANRGLAKIATLVESVRASNPNTVLVDCGDTIQGTPLESVYQYFVRTGRLPLNLAFTGPPPAADPMMLAMNHMGYAAMVTGNHEFNFGLKNLERARAAASFPWLAANIGVEPGASVSPFPAYVVKTVGGVKVAIIGVTTPSIPRWEQPENYRGYRFLPGVEAAASALAELREREPADVVLAGVHDGLHPEAATAEAHGKDPDHTGLVRDIATRVPGIDAIFFGHSHQQVAEMRIGNVLLTQPRNWGMSLARIDFVLEGRPGAWKIAGKSSRLLAAAGDTRPDPEVLAIARPYHEITERYLDAPVTRSPVAMDGSRARIEDSGLLDAVHAAQMHYARADVSFTASFNPRARIRKGPVTVREIAALYIYDNELYAIEGNGRMVKEALENAARYYLTCPDTSCSRGPLINPDVMGYNYDTAQGVQYEIDLTRPAGDRIRNLRRNGRPLQPDQRLRIAVNNYRAAGSAGYDMFRPAKILWRSSEDLRSLIIQYYTEGAKLPTAPDGNWRIVPPAAAAELAREALGGASASGRQAR